MSNYENNKQQMAWTHNTVSTIRRRIRSLSGELTDPRSCGKRSLLRQDFKETQQRLGSFIAGGAESETKDKAFVVLSATNYPLKAKFNALLAKAMQLEGYTPVIIHRRGNHDAVPYYLLFGFCNCINWDDHVKRNTNLTSIDSIIDELMPASLSMETIKACYFHGIAVGRYGLSSACRSARRFPSDLNEQWFRKLFYKNLSLAVSSVFAAQDLLKKYPVKKLLLRDIGYVPQGPVMDVALQYGVDCLVLATGQRRDTWIFKRYISSSDSRDHEFSISKENWETIKSLPWTRKMDEEVTREIDKRYESHSHSDIRRLQFGKKEISSAEVREILSLDPSKKTAVIFAHVSWDGAFFFGQDLFESFDDWLVQTTRCAMTNPHLNWIVKLHPLNLLIHEFEGQGEFAEAEMTHLSQLGDLPPHIQIMHSDTPIKTSSLFSVIDYGITVRGTVGLELPCLGIPVLTAGTGRYEGRGFTIDSDTPETYLERIRHLHKLPPLSKDAICLARIHYYHLMLRRQVSFADIARMEVRQRNEADGSLFNNIHILANSLDDIKNAKSVRSFVHWAHQRSELDFMGPVEI